MDNQQIRKAGLKVTLPRVKVLQILENDPSQHMTAEDVYKRLIENGEEIGLATVYRVLTQFEAVELATRIRAFTLFATHYFELTTLADEHPGIANVHLDAAEHGDGVVFLHAVREGPASQSYGLQVAKLAGVPAKVIERARARLRELEQGAARHLAAQSPQLPLFAPAREAAPVVEALQAIEPDALSPREALDALYRLKGML